MISVYQERFPGTLGGSNDLKSGVTVVFFISLNQSPLSLGGGNAWRKPYNLARQDRYPRNGDVPPDPYQWPLILKSSVHIVSLHFWQSLRQGQWTFATAQFCRNGNFQFMVFIAIYIKLASMSYVFSIDLTLAPHRLCVFVLALLESTAIGRTSEPRG